MLHAARAAARALAARRRAARSAGCVGILRERRPDVLHTHTAKAGATGRHRGAARRATRGRGRSSTPTTATCSAATSAAAGAGLPPDRARCSRGRPGADRGQRRGARRPRRLRRRAGASASRSCRTASTCRSGATPTTRRARGSAPSSASSDDDVRDRLGRPADRDQAAARPRPHAARRRWTTGVDAVLVLVGDGELTAPRRRRSRASSASPTACRFVGFQQRHPRLVRGRRRLAAHLRERGDARRRDRVARRGPARRRDACGRHGHGRPRTARAATCSPVGDVDGLAAPARRARPRPGAAPRAWADAGAADVRERFATARMADEIDAVYRRAAP